MTSSSMKPRQSKLRLSTPRRTGAAQPNPKGNRAERRAAEREQRKRNR